MTKASRRRELASRVEPSDASAMSACTAVARAAAQLQRSTRRGPHLLRRFRACAIASTIDCGRLHAEPAARVSVRCAGQTQKFAARLADSDNPIMTTAGKHIVDGFAGLPDAEKREVLANLLRISRDIAYPKVTDEELLSSADSLFLEYDRREADE